jgi:hypothetical protein
MAIRQASRERTVSLFSSPSHVTGEKSYSRSGEVAVASAALALSGCLLTLDFDGISDGRSRAVPPTPTSYWPLDEEDGTSAADVKGGHDGALISVSGSPHFTGAAGDTNERGHRGGALAFRGGDGAFVVADLSKTRFPRRGTFAFWTRVSSPPSERRLLFSANVPTAGGGDPATPRPLELSVEGDRFVWNSTSSARASFVDGVVANVWFLVAVSWDLEAGARAIYARPDGGRSSYAVEGLAEGLSVADATFELEHPAGLVDELRLFDRVLTRAELDAIDGA